MGNQSRRTVLAEKLAGHELVSAQEGVAAEAIHWGFGALTGAAYGALAEYYPRRTSKDGAGFGMALSSLTHETALPAMGLAADRRNRRRGSGPARWPRMWCMAW